LNVLSSSKNQRYNPTFPWNTKLCEYAKYAEAQQLKDYLFSSANHPEVRVRYNLNKIRLN